MTSLEPKKKSKKTEKTHAMYINQHIKEKLNASEAASVIFNENGDIVNINNEAAVLFNLSPEKIIGQTLWKQPFFDGFKRKRLLALARRHFQLTRQGIPQQFTWVETRHKNKKPDLAYKIILSQSVIDGNLVYFAKLQDILQFKLVEWVLWSLAKINNYESITAIIDEVVKLCAEAYHADYAMVSLIENDKITQSVSVYHSKSIINKLSYSLVHSPCSMVYAENKVTYFADNVQKLFPQADFLQELNINSYLGGPISNANQQVVVGVLTILSKETIPMTSVYKNLFKLFLDRINLEVEKLLIQRELQLLASIPQEDPNPIIRIKPNGEVIYANQEGKVIINFWKKQHGGLPAKIINDIAETEMSKEILRDEISFQEKTYFLTFVGVKNFSQIIIYGTDITQLKRAEENILNLARYDSLTKVANRQYFEEKLIKTLAIHQTENQKLALLLIDLDNFKIVNDSLGHHIGDELLKITCKRMRRCLRENDFIARLGGDEFVVVLNKTDVDESTVVAKKINEVIARPFQLGEYSIDISCSIGIAIFPESASNAHDLLKHADIAMYHAKKSGRDNYTVFSNELHKVTHRRHSIIKKDLPFAAAKNQLYLSYQPVMDLKNDQLSGFESFLRWEHPNEGLIMPKEFITMAEQGGTINNIGQWGIEQSLSDFANKLSDVSKARLSLNISVVQIKDPRFMDSLLDTLNQYDIATDQIILDVSEHIMYMEIDNLKNKLQPIYEHGIMLSLDNFGSPQISLTKLAELPINYLKLDQNLLSNIEKEEKPRLLLGGIIKLAKSLNLIVVQKGVENKEQDQILKELECPLAQGNYYCPPVKIEKLGQFIKKYNGSK